MTPGKQKEGAISILMLEKKYFSSFGSTLLTSTSLSDGTIRFLWTTAFSIIMVISILGNSSVLWIVIGD